MSIAGASADISLHTVAVYASTVSIKVVHYSSYTAIAVGIMASVAMPNSLNAAVV